MLKDVEPIIENTSMQIYDNKTYWIKPNAKYKLHEKGRDIEDIDTETGKPILILGFNESISTCSIDYDFEANEREFYTIPIEENPIIELAEETDFTQALESLGVDFNG
jgi:hypothetical protein